MFKILGIGEGIISCDLMCQFYCYSVFSFSQVCQEFNMAKLKVIIFKIAENWQVLLYKLNIWEENNFIIISPC